MPQSKEKRIEQFLERAKLRAQPLPLKGDASTRSFYRIPFHKGTAVMMVYDTPQPEVERTFLDVHDHLSACGVPVPRIYDYDQETSIMLIEDCGDISLEERLRGAAPEEYRHFYRCAIEILLKIQITGTAARRECAAFSRSFDEHKLTEELDFFLTHTVEGFFKARLAKGEKEGVRQAFTFLAARLSGLPRAFNHRDYHSRNLMAVDRSLMVVDFQDARMGPCQYDLASLLRDSYTVLDGEFRYAMIDYYQLKSSEMGISWHNREDFLERFDLMSLQRNLKACGTFGYMSVVRGNNRYVHYLEPTFAYVREVAPQFSFMSDCLKILGRYVPFL
ncbi:MAG: phosphotransferase [Candidatus Aureabacteria bacterium]|nr:phosphotransferase [Candidatus Auribacterota bacterium]